MKCATSSVALSCMTGQGYVSWSKEEIVPGCCRQYMPVHFGQSSQTLGVSKTLSKGAYHSYIPN